MAAPKGKLEGLITVPAGGWSFVLTENVGAAQTVSLTAATTYYWSSAGNDSVDLPARIKALLEAASVTAGNTRTYTVTISNSETSRTGKLTISGSAGTFTIDQFKKNGVANNALRRLLGFTADLSPTAASFTSDAHVQHLWLADRAVYNGFGSGDYGVELTDARSAISPGGDVSVLWSQFFRESTIDWQQLSRAKTRIAGELVVGESYQQFFRDVLLGQLASAATGGGPLRFYDDAATDTGYATGKVDGRSLKSHRPQQHTDRWIGLWNVSLVLVVQ